MNALEIINSVLMTTDNTQTFLYRCFESCTEKDKKIVLRQLKRPFSELKEEYILPKIYRFEDSDRISFYPNYQKNIDDSINVREKFILEDATNNWLFRKETEISEINLIYNAHKKQKRSFETIDNFLNDSQLKELYNLLASKNNEYITDCTFENFAIIFSSDTVEIPPKIKWCKSAMLFFSFFELLDYFNVIQLKEDNISAKLYDGEFFVRYNTKTNKVFKLGELSKYSKRNEIKNHIENFVHINKELKFERLEDMEDFKMLASTIKSFKRT